MKPEAFRFAIASAVVSVAVLCTNLPAQTIIEGGTARENVRTAGARSPGNMVNAGLARADSAITIRLDGSVDITETSRPATLHSLFVPPAVQIIVDQINAFFAFILNQFLLRAGFDAIDLTAVLAPGSGDDGTTGTGDSGTGTDGTSGDGTKDGGDTSAEDDTTTDTSGGGRTGRG